MEWKNITDRRPEAFEDVLMINSNEVMHVGSAWMVDDEYLRIRFGGTSMAARSWEYPVTHWMPLPSPPHKQEVK